MKKVLFAATTALLLSVSSAAMAADKFVGEWLEDYGIGSKTLVVSKVSQNEIHVKESSLYGGNYTINYIVDGNKLLANDSTRRVLLTLIEPDLLRADGSDYKKQ